MELDIIRSAHKAGLRMAEFREKAGASPREAVNALEGFGSALTSAFNASAGPGYTMRTLALRCSNAAAFATKSWTCRAQSGHW